MDFMKKVNEISKIVGKTATDTYNTVADKSGKAIQDAKLKISIADVEDEINIIYEQIGKTVYDMYKKGEDVGNAFTKESKKIDKKNKEIIEMKKTILFNKGLRICENCGETISVESYFCKNCGSKQKKIKIKEDKKNEKEDKVELNEKVCPECGLISEPNVKYCQKCGHEF